MTKWTEEEQQAALKLCRQTIDNELYKITSAEIVGSTYILGEGQDIDCLFLVEGINVDEVGFDGWLYGGSVGEGNESHWGSWTRGKVNILITSRKDYYDAWLTSAEVCRLLFKRGYDIHKTDRVAIHNIVMNDSTAEAEVMRMNKGLE